MSITTKLGLKAAAATALTAAAVGGLALAPATAAGAAPADGATVTVTLRLLPSTPRGFVDSFATSVMRSDGWSSESSCDYLDAGPVTTKTVTAKVGEEVWVLPTAGCYLITNTSLKYPVTADTKVIDVQLPLLR